ncbi:hypothetical protein GVX82_01210 [Patescibacteria group bacterium]|jgi:hypothetical protein|nr:hypothetical protein [Patescibacteria group bacterium]
MSGVPLSSPRQWLAWGSALVALALLALYVLFQARLMLAGPAIVLTSPDPQTPLVGATATVTGRALNATALYLNDRQILTDRQGYFEETLLFPVGYTEMQMAVEDRFGTRRAYTFPITRIE